MSRSHHSALAAALVSGLLAAAPLAAQDVTRTGEAAPPPAPAALPDTTATRPLETPVSLAPRTRPRDARRPYTLVPELDAAVLVTSAALWITPEYMYRELVPLGRCPCDPAVLNDLDRPFAGLNVPGTGPVSNAVTGVLLSLPAVFDAFDVWHSGGTVPEWLEDTVVIGEALMVNGAINEVLKFSFQRPRPQAYGIDPGDGRLNDPDTYLSFYSLSASEAFAAAAAGATTFALRHPHSPWRWVYIAGAGTLAAGFSLSRVLTGRHFPTDVLAGAGIGTMVGIVVPWLHQRHIPVTIGAGAAPGVAIVTATMVTP